jgi:hypothetical protein
MFKYLKNISFQIKNCFSSKSENKEFINNLFEHYFAL